MPQLDKDQSRATDQSQSTTQTGQAGADGGKRDAQGDYARSLVSPAQKARSALKAAGMPLDTMIPDNVVAFEQKPDGSFTLKLGSDVRRKVGDVTLVLTTNISGRLGSGTLTDVSGIYGEKKVAFITGKGNVTKVTRAGDELVIETDNSMAKEVRVKVAALKGGVG
jgi:hypothetical protein